MIAYTESIVARRVEDYFHQRHNTQNFLVALGGCYANSSALFQRIISVNDTVFVMTDFENEDQIIGYLFYTDREDTAVIIDGELTRCIYNGYAFINLQYRKTGAFKKLLLFATEFYKKKYSNAYNQLLFYAVTSNPFALRGYYNVFKTARPSLDGLLTRNDLLVADKLKNSLFSNSVQTEYPFTLKTNLPQRYHESFSKTFDQLSSDETRFLDQTNINERNGDRFLFYWTSLV